MDLEGFAVVAFAVADFARYVDVGQEVHFDLDDAVAFTVFAAPALDIKTKTAGAVTTQFGFGYAGKQLTDRREQPGIGGGIGTRRAADRRLVDNDRFVEQFNTLDFIVTPRYRAGAVQASQQFFGQNIIDQARFARAADAADDNEFTERDFDVNILEIVFARPFNDESRAVAGPTLFGDGDVLAAGQVLGRHAAGDLHDFSRRAGGNDLTAVNTSPGADIEQVVGGANRFFVVFNDDDSVTEITQVFESPDQPGIVALVQADTRFVKHVEHAHQTRANLRRQADTLGFAARQGGGTAQQVEVVQADVLQELQAGTDFLED